MVSRAKRFTYCTRHRAPMHRLTCSWIIHCRRAPRVSHEIKRGGRFERNVQKPRVNPFFLNLSLTTAEGIVEFRLESRVDVCLNTGE